jgi:hypothetical protein
MKDVVLRVAVAIDEGFGAHGQWDRLIVDQETQAHREDLKKVAGLALNAVADLDWPDLSAKAVSLDGTIAVMIPAETVRSMVRRTIGAALEVAQPSGT